MSEKRLLLLNGSFSEITLIEVAHKLGYYVITSGNNPKLIGHSYADEYIAEDYSDKEAILHLVEENNIDCIVSCANDFGVISACYVAEKLGLPGHDTYENALLLHHKDLFKNLVNRLGIRAPLSQVFNSRDEAMEYARDAKYPIMVKAVDLTGGKGIHRADDYNEAIKAIDNAYERTRSSSIIIEPCIEGVQQSIDTFVINKKVVASVSNDCYMPINPYLIQTETLPARGIELIQDELHGIIERICDELNLVDGMFTLQYIIRDGKPYIIEMMRRCLGNQFLTVAHAVSGFPWEEALVRAETGMSLENLKWEKPMAQFVGHHGVMGNHNGVVRGYEVDPEFEKHIFKSIDIIPSGGSINDYMNERVAYLYYAFNDRKEIDTAASHINDLCKVIYA